MQLSSILHKGQRISVREAEILLACADGLTISQAAGQLFLSVNTVKRHHTNIRNKFGLRGPHALRGFALALRPELVQWIPGLTTPPTNGAENTNEPRPTWADRAINRGVSP